MIQLAHALGIPCTERRLSLTEFYVADEVFTTGTMGELTPVNSVDGRHISVTEIGQNDTVDTNAVFDSVLKRLQAAYKQLVAVEGVPLPF